MIHVRGLSRVYKTPKRRPGWMGSLRGLFSNDVERITAVDGIDLDVSPGERVGFLGPNGAGKTTTLKMLSGLLVPTAGEVRVRGFVPQHRDPEFLRRITLVMGQKMQLLWDLPAVETWELNRAVFNLDDADYLRTRDELIELLDLGGLLHRPVRQLSLGERMKCELAAALLHRPELLFLDEPTLGLDVTMQEAVRRFIADWNTRSGVTVLLTSHYMADVEALCPRIVLIAHGRIRFDGLREDLVREVAGERRIQVHLARALTPLEKEHAGPFQLRDGLAEATVPRVEVADAVAHALASFPVADLRIEEPPLEDVIRKVFAEDRGNETR